MTFRERVQNQLNTSFEPGRDYFEQPENYEREIRDGIKWSISKYGHKRIDEHCPYKQGQLTCVIGNSNVGKTTLILYLLSKLLHERRLLIYSAENRISQLARYIITFCFGHKNYEKHFKWLRDRVIFIKHEKQFTYKDMLEQFAIADDIGFDPKCIFIDPYNSLKVAKNNNGHEYHYEAIEDMRIFTQQSNKSIFLNCHTVTDAQRIKANNLGEIPAPIMGDVEGGGKFPNKADDVWIIHRHLYHIDEERRKTSFLYVGKVRNTEGGGKPTGWTSPIEFQFKNDWTGFTTREDEVESYMNQMEIYGKQ